jgi:hypothetical protein
MNTALTATLRVALGVCLLATFSLPAQSPSADEIMKSSDRVYRGLFTTALIKVQLTTCRYAVKDGAIGCREKPRISVLEAVEKKWGPERKDSRSVVLVLQPVSDKGVGMLTYEYFDGGRDNDVLLYLPALGKTRRIVSGGGGNEDGGSFFGTEFFVDDNQLRKIDQYSYKLLRDDTYEGRPVWVIESTPNAKRAGKTQYSKTHVWVDKERRLIVREDIFNKAGKFYRQRLNTQYTQVDGVWIAKRQTMKNLLTQRFTVINNLSASYNREVSNELLTERSLTDVTYRERELAAIRSQGK